MRLPKMQLPLSLLFLGAMLCAKSSYCLSRDGKEAAALKRNVFVPPNSNMPVFKIEEDNPDFPDEVHAEIRRRMGEAFNDMLTMAGFACATFSPMEPVYLRYFGEQRGSYPSLVHSFICSIAGYDDPSTCNVLDVTTRPPQVNPKYRKLTIIAGQDERLHDEGGGDRDIVPAATTYQELEDEITDDEDAAITEITKRGLDYPGLVQIINDRGCDALGPADSGLMTSLGAHLLHEMVHWRFLMRTAAVEGLYDAVIPVAQLIWDSDDEDDGKEEKITHTIDYSSSASPLLKSNNPPDGYGPANAAQLVINNQGDSVQNADNYRWYVVSKYWQWICKRQFDKQDDPEKDDKMIPPESNGQVPYPGEVLEEQDPPPRARLFAML